MFKKSTKVIDRLPSFDALRREFGGYCHLILTEREWVKVLEKYIEPLVVHPITKGSNFSAGYQQGLKDMRTLAENTNVLDTELGK